MQIVDLGALPVSFRIVFIPVLGFCHQNPGRSSIFPEALKIRPKNSFLLILREYWSLELFFLDKNLANQGFKDINQISQFVDLAFSCVINVSKHFCMHTLPDT
jgi:hypothetical protein